MTVIDSHMHVNYHGYSPEKLIRYLDKNRIDCCWLLSWEETVAGPWNYQHLSIEDIYDTYLKYPSRIIPMYAPDPHKESATVELSHWHKKGIRGCGEMKSIVRWDSSEVKGTLSTVEKLGIPLVFHMQESERRFIPYSSALYDRIICRGLQTKRGILQIPKKILYLLTSRYSPLRNRRKYYTFPGYMLDFASLEIALRDHPNINFIAHGPMFWNNFHASSKSGPRGDGVIGRLLQEYANLYADISASGFIALAQNPLYAKRFLSIFEDKILYGTDNIQGGQRDYLNSLGLSQRIYKKIYGENACRLINK